jgi:hypothetical protein
VAVIAVFAVATGCGPKGIKKLTVTGKVSYKGQPVTAGILQFTGANGSYSAASIQPDGTYIITDVVPDEVKVSIQEAPQSGGSSSGERVKPQAAPVALPAKYRTADKTDLRYTITDSTKELNIEIQ